MNAFQKLAKNIGFLTIGQFSTLILGFLLFIYIARFLGEANFGVFSFALSFTSLFTLVADIGINQYITREIARNKDIFDDYLGNALMIKIPLAFITIFLIYLLINFIETAPQTIYIVCLFGVYTIFASFISTFRSIFQAYEMLEYTSIILILERLLLIPLVLIFFLKGYALTGLAYAYIISGITVCIIGLYLIFNKIKRIKFRIDLNIWKIYLKKSLSFGLSGVFTVSFFKIDTVILDFLKNDFAVGVYNAAYNPLLQLSTGLSGIAISALYPVMSRYYISSSDSLTFSTVLSTKYLAIIGFPITTACFVMPDKFIHLFYGNQYSASIIAFQILAFLIPFRLISSITGTLLTSINRQGARTFAYFIGLGFNILLNLILIPSLSFVGASISTILSELLIYLMFIYFINRYYKSLKIHSNFIKPFIASLAMGVFIYYLQEFNIIFIIIISALIYLVALFLLRTFTKEDKYILKQVIGKFNL